MALLVSCSIASVGVTSASASASDADSIANLVNQARANAGLPGLIHNPAMDSVAVNWANQMSASNHMGHNPNYSSQIPSGWTRVGENVAMGQPTPSAMHAAWMNSPGHRANILGDFTDIGIAFVTVNGTTWGVEDFGKYAGHTRSPAPAPAPAPIASAPASVAKSSTTAAGQVPVPAAGPSAPSSTAPSSTAPTLRAPSPDAGKRTDAGPAAASRRETASPAQPDASASPGWKPLTLSATSSAAQNPFPFGYVIGGILVIIGIGGGIYGQRLRIRGRRPPRP